MRSRSAASSCGRQMRQFKGEKANGKNFTDHNTVNTDGCCFSSQSKNGTFSYESVNPQANSKILFEDEALEMDQTTEE